MSYSPYTPEERIQAARDYLNGIRSISEIMQDLSVCRQAVRDWTAVYQNHGESAFAASGKNQTYTKEFKQMVVKEYAAGRGSLGELSAKYSIRSRSTLRKWVMRYNRCMEQKDYVPQQEVYMAASGRKTTENERLDIAVYCMEHGRDYKGAAQKYKVSCRQVYSWVKKYDAAGEEGLADRRGRHKPEEEVDELEKLRRENRRLKRQLEEKDMAVELLKKVKEFGRRRF